MTKKPTYEELEQRVRKLEQKALERERLEQIDRNDAELLTFFIKHSPIYAFLKVVTDQDSKVLYASDNYIDMIGVPASQMVGKTMDKLFPRDFAEKITKDDIEVVHQGKNLKLEEELNGRRYITYKFPLKQNGGKYLAGYTIDITDLKQAETESKQSEEALRKSKALLDATSRMAKVGGWKLNPATLAVSWTEETYRIHELPPDYQPLLEEAINFFHPKDRNRLEMAVQKALDQGEPYDLEIRFITAKGNHLWTRTMCRPKIADGKVVMLEGTFQDITDRKNAEIALQESEERFRLLSDVTMEGILIHKNGVALDMNESFSRILGYQRDELIGKNVLEYCIHPDDMQTVRENIAKGSAHPYIVRNVRKNGEVFFAEIEARDIQTGDTRMRVAAVRDITERIEAEIELKTKNDLLNGILDSIKDVIGVLDPDFTMIRYNKAGYALLGLTPEDVRGKKCYELIGHSEPCGNCSSRAAMISKTSETTEKYFPELEKYFNCTSNPIVDENGKIKLIIEQLTDITEKKKLDEQIQQAQKMESIGNLAGGIAHDFNNILFPIVGLAEILLDDLPPGSSERENAEEIFKAGKRGSELVKQILAFSRQSERKLAPTRVQKILGEVLKLSRSTIPSSIEIHQDIQSDCGLVMADPTLIHQVAMNIITNAYHAVENEGGSILVQLAEIESGVPDRPNPNLGPGKYAVLSVSDTGCGMSADVIDKIFEPYFTTKEQGKGTGLGLAVVHGIVQEHHGAITIDSEIGQGTTIKVYLPLMQKTEGAEPTRVPKAHPTGTERILLVDDEEPIAKLEKQMLERLGYKVTMRLNSIEALNVFKANPDSFDLVLSDMTMPSMTGDQLALELMTVRPDIPVIICTGFSEKLDEEKAKLIGIKGLLMKPVVRSELAQTVRRILDNNKV